jgi:MFS family permease
MPLSLAAFITSTSTLFGLIGAPLGGFMASRIGDMKWLQISLLSAFTLLAVSFQVNSNSLFMVLYLLYGFSGTMGMAARSALMAKLTPRSQRGLGYALFFLPGSIIGAISPVVAGFLAGIVGFQSIFNLAVAINFSSLAILRFTVKVD